MRFVLCARFSVLGSRLEGDLGPGDVAGEGGFDVGAGVARAGGVAGGVKVFGHKRSALGFGDGEFDAKWGAGWFGGDDLRQGALNGLKVREIDVVKGARLGGVSLDLG